MKQGKKGEERVESVEEYARDQLPVRRGVVDIWVFSEAAKMREDSTRLRDGIRCSVEHIQLRLRVRVWRGVVAQSS